jgi:tape measure domain-containing protein
MGQNFYVIAKQFKSLSAAAKGTTLEGKGVHDIFRAITKASASLGLTAYETEGSLYAVQQMISKATVQSEELRGQLGERLPGAFRMAAEAMGMTMPQLSKQLELGNIMAEDLLPKLARVLENTYSGEVSEAVEASNKLSEAWKTLRYNIAKSGFLSEASHSVMSLAQTMDSPALQSSLRDIGVGLGQMIKDSRRLIPLLKDLTSGLGGVVSVLGRLSDVYSAFPSEITSGVGAGIILRILTGSTPVGVVTALLVTLNQAMEKLNQQWKAMLPTMQSMGKEGSNFSNNIQNIMDVLNGNRDWNTGEFTESGKQRNSANRRADLREKYAGTWAAYDADAERQVALINEEYEKKQRAHQQFREQKDRERAILSGTYIAPKTKQDLKEYNSFYADLDKLRGVSYEKELKDLRIEKEIHAATINDKLAVEEWFQLRKKKLQEKYRVDTNSMSSEAIGEFFYKQMLGGGSIDNKRADRRGDNADDEITEMQAVYDEKQRILDEFTEAHARSTMSASDYAIMQLDRERTEFESTVTDKVALDQWYAASRARILRMYGEQEEDWTDGVKSALEDFQNYATDVSGNVETVMYDSLNGVSDCIADFVATGKASWSDLERSIVQSITNMTTKYLMAQTLMGGGSFEGGNVGGLIGMGIDLFTGSSFNVGGAAGTSTGTGGGFNMGNGVVTGLHNGGIAGQEATFRRSVDMSMFHGAPRFHDGLLPDEFPAILKRGEGVFTQEQMKALGGGGNKTDVRVVNNFYVQPDAGGNISQKSQRQISRAVTQSLGRLR